MQVIKSLDPVLRDAIIRRLLFMAQDPGGKAVLRSLYNNDFLRCRTRLSTTTSRVLVKAGVDPAELVK